MKYAIVNGIILDGQKGMVARDGYTILVDGDKITDVIHDGSEDISSYEIIDAEKKYIMPGMINLHIHLPGSGKPKKKQTDVKKLVKFLTSNDLLRMVVKKMCIGFAKTQLFSGVTTVRTVGGVEDIDGKIRDEINSGKVIGPRIYASNMALSVPGGHMAGSLAKEAVSVESAEKLTQEIIDSKPDLLKLMITGGVLDAKVKGEPGVLKMPLEYVKAACDVAHKAGLKVAAHVESPEGVEVALKGGVDTIEHGAKPNDEIIRLFKETGAAHVATLSPALPYALFDPAISHVNEMEQYNGKVVFDGIIECARECLKNDIPVGLGTDTGCPYITHYDMWREVNYFAKYCGVSNSFAIHTATLGNAKILGKEKELGSIEEGKYADLLFLKENPLENLQNLRNIDTVIIGGKIIKNPKVKKMREVETELDKFI